MSCGTFVDIKKILREQGTSTPQKIKKKSEDFTEEKQATTEECTQGRMPEAHRDASSDKADGESAVREKIVERPEPDRSVDMRHHMILKASALMKRAVFWKSSS